ncbi:hypothetical protein ACFQVD_26935 [Streptosporangium amethystogenes subsp. fukuiense]|uniref:Transposase n=1 Tax=Streptosporangium amethystogenes subsp. fukuiense TaxID=698418 RepID=A0ABW2T6H9_9ACTN
MANSKPPTDIAADAAAWQKVKARFPGTTREVLDRIELGARVVSALDDTLDGGHP